MRALTVPGRGELQVYRDPQALARALAEFFVRTAATAAADRGAFRVALSGGSTPRAAYELLAKPPLRDELSWSDVFVYFGDERCVPPEDERSNHRLAKESMFDALGEVGLPAIHRMKGELGPFAAAEDYERVLREAGSPRFDLVLLGIGPDGHCASLFPDQPSLDERSRAVVGVAEAGLEPYVPRVSMTLPRLANARQIVFLVTGESKADAIAAVFGAHATPDPHMPSSLLVPLAKEIKVLLDPAAASRLGSRAGQA